ncbi:MAG: hypothetical protein ACRELC_10155 [Gemmatimonadota bacterium]
MKRADEGRRYHFAVKLVRLGPERDPAVEIASVFAFDLGEAIALAMARYPGFLAVHGERH